MPPSAALPPLSAPVPGGVPALSSGATSLPLPDAAAPYAIPGPPGPPGPPEPRAFSPDSFEWEEWRGDWPFVLHAVAGSFAGVMEHLTMYPIDTLKTRMQAFSGSVKTARPPCEVKGSGRCSTGCGESFTGGRAPSDHSVNGKGGMTSGRQLAAAAWMGPARGPGPPVALPVLRPPFTAESAATPFRWFVCSVGGRPRVSAAAERAANCSSPWPLPMSDGAFRSAQQSKEGSKKLPSLMLDRGGVGRPLGAAGLADLRGGCALTLYPVLRRVREEGSNKMQIRGLSAASGGEGFGLVSGLKQVYKEGGLKGLYRGASAVAAGCVPAHACYFMSFELVKEKMCARARSRQQMEQTHQKEQQGTTHQPTVPTAPAVNTPQNTLLADSLSLPLDVLEGPPRPPKNPTRDAAFAGGGTQGLTHGELLACGVCATFSHEVVLTPVDVIKQRMQLGCFSSLRSCVTSTLRREGPLAFVRSLPASVLLNLPYGAALVYTNESLKRRLAAGQPAGALSLPIYFFCAGVSGGVAGLISNPLDVVKTRLQTQDCAVRESRAPLAGMATGGPCPLSPCPPKYQSLLGTVKTIWIEEGISGFWRGVSGRVCLSIPATAICWGSYETFKFLWRAFAV